MAGFLDEIDIEQEMFDKNEGSTLAKEFEVLPSGAVPAEIESVIMYVQNGKTKEGVEFSSTKLKVTVKTTEEGRVISFRNDIGKTKADGSINEGFVARLKSIGLATGFDVNDFKRGEEVEVNSFGKTCKGQVLNGVNGKKVIALVRHTVDINKAKGESYRDTNDLEAIVAKGDDQIADFEAKVAKKEDGIFTVKGYVKPSAGGSVADTSVAKDELKKIDF